MDVRKESDNRKNEDDTPSTTKKQGQESPTSSVVSNEPKFTLLDPQTANLLEKSGKRPRVLNLFDVKTSKPILNHCELEKKLNSLGFFAQPLPSGAVEPNDDGESWKEYAYNAEAFVLSLSKFYDFDLSQEPRPRLPYPGIDMLHPHTYKAFLFALGTYITHAQVGEHLDIRSVPPPIDNGEDEMVVDLFPNDNLIYIDQLLAYRKGSIDEMTISFYSAISQLESSAADSDSNNMFLKRRGRAQ